MSFGHCFALPASSTQGGGGATLNMDFLSGALPSQVTFSRGTQATMYGVDGTLQYAPNNVLLQSQTFDNASWTKTGTFIQTNIQSYSQDFDNAAWVKTAVGVGSLPVVTQNVYAAPNGTMTADLVALNLNGGTLSTDQSTLQGTSGTSVTGASYTGSIYVIAATGADVGKVIAFRHAAGGAYVTITLTATWQRFSNVEVAVGVSSAITFGLRGTVGSSTGAVSFYVWGAQLVQGSVPGNYQATTSAALPVLYTAPDGTLTALKACQDTAGGSHTVGQAVSVTAPPAKYSFSVYVKAGEQTSVALQQVITTSYGATFNLVTQAITGLIGSGTTATITSAGNGWFRCTLNYITTAVIAQNNAIYVLSGTGDGSSGCYIWGAQTTISSPGAAYVPTTTAVYYGPRFDYDPVTKVARGLLIEEPRTNQLLQSNDFQTSWTPTNVTRTLASITGPDGISSGVKIEATTTAASTLLQGSAIANTAATFSVYVKQGSGATTANNFVLRNNTTATNLIVGTFNYSTGAWAYSTGSTGVIVTNVSNGWWRISLSAITGITSGDTIVGYVGFSGNTQTAGDFFYAYGAQLEASGFATSYIFTTTATVLRSADLASVNTLTPWYNATEGTLVVQAYNFVPDADIVVRMIAALTDTASYTNAIRLERTVGNWRDVQTVAGVAVAAAGSWLVGVPGKLAGAYKASDSAGTFNGAAPASIGTSTVPIGVTYLAIGSNGFGTNNWWDGWIQSIKYYPFRVPNATLQSITT